MPSLLRRTLTKAEAHSAITGLVDTEFYRVRVAFHTTTLQVNGTMVVDPGFTLLAKSSREGARVSWTLEMSAVGSISVLMLLLDSGGSPHECSSCRVMMVCLPVATIIGIPFTVVGANMLLWLLQH